MSITVYRQKPNEPISDESFYYNGTYTGIKYQCVELARRYYLINYGVYIPIMENAKDIFSMHMLYNMITGHPIFWDGYLNISTSPPPVRGSLLVWATGEGFEYTGHVAVVVNVTKQYVYIIEQNYGQGKRKLPIHNGAIVSQGLIGWKMPPYWLV